GPPRDCSPTGPDGAATRVAERRSDSPAPDTSPTPELSDSVGHHPQPLAFERLIPDSQCPGRRGHRIAHAGPEPGTGFTRIRAVRLEECRLQVRPPEELLRCQPPEVGVSWPQLRASEVDDTDL